MHSVLSYFNDYYSPDYAANPDLHYHSAAWIARNVYRVLSEFGTIEYIDSRDASCDLKADLFIGHFWRFAQQVQRNDFRHAIALYSIANPDWTRQELIPLAHEYQVPFPDWDFPPTEFCNHTTLSLADEILLVGNKSIVNTFPIVYHDQLHPLNYAVDNHKFFIRPQKPLQQFCYVATQCDLRKGFMDVLRTWQALGDAFEPIHLIGEMSEPWTQKLRSCQTVNIRNLGWINSSSPEYVEQLQSHRFAYIPTYSEGQMGTVLEAIFSGCIPITTLMSGVDERVLKHCLIVEPRNIAQHVSVIREVSQWSDTRWYQQRQALLKAAHQYQSESVFCDGVRRVIHSVLEQDFQREHHGKYYCG